jgi:pyruvate carboxylase subunit B
MAVKHKKTTPNPLKIMDTTFRDGHQSSLATRMRYEDMEPVAEQMNAIGWHAMEVWGGATFDVPTRFLNEDPWDRLRKLRKALPDTKLQMLLRGQNVVGYRNYADDVVREFCLYTAENGLDIFRVFDALNDVRNFETAFRAIKEAGKHIQGCICYSQTENRMGGPVYNIEYYVEKGTMIEKMGADSLCIKDMAGLMSPYDAYDLVKALKAALKIPIQLHTHYTSGSGSMTYLKAIEAGVDIIDTALAPFALRTSQPAVEPIVVALEGTDRDTGLDLEKIVEAGNFIESIAPKYRRFLDDTKMAVIDTGVLLHHVPGGMQTNLVANLKEANALDRLNDVYEELPKTRKELGYPPLVTPTSQIVGIQAVMNVLMGRYKMITNEVKDYCFGLYGAPPAPIDKKIQKMALKGYPRGETPITGRPADILEPEMEKAREVTQNIAKNPGDVLIYALYPQTGLRFLKWKYGMEPVPKDALPVTLEDIKKEDELIKKALKGELVEKSKQDVVEKGAGIRKFSVFVDGSHYAVKVVPEGGVLKIAPVSGMEAATASQASASAPVPPSPQAAPKPAAHIPIEGVSGSITAPMPGIIVEVTCALGDKVAAGQQLIVLEAMKMQNPLAAPVDGEVKAIYVNAGDSVAVGQVLIDIG